MNSIIWHWKWFKWELVINWHVKLVFNKTRITTKIRTEPGTLSPLGPDGPFNPMWPFSPLGPRAPGPPRAPSGPLWPTSPSGPGRPCGGKTENAWWVKSFSHIQGLWKQKIFLNVTLNGTAFVNVNPNCSLSCGKCSSLNERILCCLECKKYFHYFLCQPGFLPHWHISFEQNSSQNRWRGIPFCFAVMRNALGCILMRLCKLGRKVRTPQLGDAFSCCLVYGMLTHGCDSHSQISEGLVKFLCGHEAACWLLWWSWKTIRLIGLSWWRRHLPLFTIGNHWTEKKLK